MPIIDKNFIERVEEFKATGHKAVPVFDDAPRYEEAELVKLFRLQDSFLFCDDAAERERIKAEFTSQLSKMAPKADAPDRIYLWEGTKMPVSTLYTDNSDLRYNHEPDFRPYMFEMLTDDPHPKGAVVVIPGGDHGFCTVYEGYQVSKDLNKLGYQCFLLQNRPNHSPWSEEESGADTARAIRMIRANVGKYRITGHDIAVAGFSNGGLTGDNCIRHYSGTQTVKDHFPDYVPDALDEVYGSPDAFLCVYGPRFKGSEYDFTNVVYPPTFFAVGKDDTAMDNLNYVYPIMIEHGVDVEVHTFSGVPHGVAGQSIVNGKTPYPTFDLWYQLADAFMQHVYSRNK